MVAACLVKDPKKRPSAEKLLKHHFFKQARPHEYLTKTILDSLPPLGDRFRQLKTKEANFLVQNKPMYGDKEHLSQQEYIRGISAWNFNLEDLKTQAALIQDFDEIPSDDLDNKHNDGYDDVCFSEQTLSPIKANGSDSAPKQEDELNDLQNVEDPLASFPTLPLRALKGCFDVGEDDVNANCPDLKVSPQTDSSQTLEQQSSPRAEEQERIKNHSDLLERSSSLPQFVIPGEHKKTSSENVLYPSRNINGIGGRDCTQHKYQVERNYSGPLYRQKREVNEFTSVEDTSEGTVVQLKGRFKVMSADRSPKGATNSMVTPFSGGSTIPPPTLTAASVLPSLQYILQQNNMQREQIIKLIKYLEQSPGPQSEVAEAPISDLSQNMQGSPASARERELQSQVIQLQQSIGSIVEELQRLKMRNAQIGWRYIDKENLGGCCSNRQIMGIWPKSYFFEELILFS